MPEAECPNCGFRTLFAADQAGSRHPCEACGHEHVLAEAPEHSPRLEQLESDAASESPTGKQRSSGCLAGFFAFLGGVGLLAALLCVLFALLIRSSELFAAGVVMALLGLMMIGMFGLLDRVTNLERQLSRLTDRLGPPPGR